ncbi:hypothetical protein [Komagataeibacter sp. FNDCF1]|uniref:hypothetical protein n=1 Tax=Komagataeibacter sp. FNDCF1 TaxID=2878681 RepID=UPI001E5A4F4F|nr:hypothetical protein [Komagataeibacter sp. FNDCF1]MCE2563506.1 hypothetical protein [Komagataeibacter sp. FNDCF1]
MSVANTLREAIEKKMVVGFTFNGKNYVGSPHALGESDGVPQVLIYRGEDSHEKRVPPTGEWSTLPLSAMTGMKLLPGEAFHTGHPDAHAAKGLHKVDVRVA